MITRKVTILWSDVLFSIEMGFDMCFGKIDQKCVDDNFYRIKMDPIQDFFELEKSEQISNQLHFTAITRILSKIFNMEQIEKTQTYQYNTKLESQDNHQLIIESWHMLFFGERLPERFKKNVRLVFWTIEMIVKLFNEKYQPRHQVIFERVTKSQRNSDGTRGTITHYDLKF
jgi:hypothetical protein